LSKDRAGNQEITAETGRTRPDRRWFGNTRVIGQKELDSFREAMSERLRDPYAFVLRAKSLPMGLLTDTAVARRTHLLSTESFSTTFGPKSQRKRVKLASTDTSALALAADTSLCEYDLPTHVDKDRSDLGEVERPSARHSIFDKGQSKRIWAELYKVLDCSDVVVQVCINAYFSKV
jgi:nuclear GTP-binding protein